MGEISWKDFEKVDIRVGEIIKVEDFPEAIKPAYKLTIDFGELGIKKSSAQLTRVYSKKELLGRQVFCVVNFPPKQVATFLSEVLVLGTPDKDGECILAKPDKEAQLGGKFY